MLGLLALRSQRVSYQRKKKQRNNRLDVKQFDTFLNQKFFNTLLRFLIPFLGGLKQAHNTPLNKLPHGMSKAWVLLSWDRRTAHPQTG